MSHPIPCALGAGWLINMTNNSNSGEMIIYEGADGAPGIEVRVEGEMEWLSQ